MPAENTSKASVQSEPGEPCRILPSGLIAIPAQYAASTLRSSRGLRIPTPGGVCSSLPRKEDDSTPTRCWNGDPEAHCSMGKEAGTVTGPRCVDTHSSSECQVTRTPEAAPPAPPPSGTQPALRSMGKVAGTVSWEERWRQGRTWEERAVELLKGMGWMVVSLANLSSGPQAARGPQLEGATSSLVLPDVLACKEGVSCWFEIKYKASTTYHRNSRRTEVGIPEYLLQHYLGIQKATGIEVRLAFLIGDERALLVANLKDATRTRRIYDGHNMPTPMVFMDVACFTRYELDALEGDAEGKEAGND